MSKAAATELSTPPLKATTTFVMVNPYNLKFATSSVIINNAGNNLPLADTGFYRFLPDLDAPMLKE
jgi:hypothetical protein